MNEFIDNDIDHLKKSRRETIYSKGFDMLNSGRGIEYRTVNDTYKKIKVGVKNLDDAVLELGALKKTVPTAPFHNKYVLMKAIVENDIRMLREFSRFFYKTNGIYARLC